MNYQPGWDSEWDASVPDFSVDLRYGMRGEVVQAKVWRIIREEPHRVEVKSERTANGKHFIETHQKRRGCADYEPSGLLTTTADLWVVVVAESSMKIYTVADMLTMWHRQQLGQPQDGGLGGDNPTRGHVCHFAWLDQRVAANRRQA